MSTGTSPRLVMDVQHHQQNPPPKPPRRPRGRWIWVISGVTMIVALGLPITRDLINAGNEAYPTISASPAATRVVTITEPVTSVNVQSYGGDIRVIGDPRARSVQVTEGIEYDPKQGLAPAVIDTVSDGQLTLAAPACDMYNCSVGFTVTVPSRVSVTTVSGGGNVAVSSVAGATVDSGGGTVLAISVAGPLTVTTGGGNQQLVSIDGVLKTDSGGGSVVVQGVTGPAATIITDGGDLTALGMAVQSATLSTNSGGARIGFTTAPGSVDVATDGGDATVTVPGGPYGLIADSGGGPEIVGIAASPAARASLSVTTSGGSLTILPAPAPAPAGGSASLSPDKNG
jgi:hypothetical protein